jgi:hypothetical protein
VTEEEGEVAIRQNGHVHAVDAPSLDDAVLVDVDHDNIVLPPGVSVEYLDDSDMDVESEEIAPDGGTVARTDVEMHGFGLSEDQSGWAIGIAAVLLLTSGWLFATDVTGMAAIVCLVAGGALGYMGVQSWRHQP